MTLMTSRFLTRGLRALVVIAGLSCGLSVVSSGTAEAAAGWSCVPYARSISTVDLRGDAWRWWDNASGVYSKGQSPKAGSVLVFKKTRQMSRGHVAVVREVVSSRKIIIDHANWSRDGKVEQKVGVIDVSPKNDWSKTRVWYGPVSDYGNTTYETYGFIYSGGGDAPKVQPDAKLYRASTGAAAVEEEAPRKGPKAGAKTKLSEKSLTDKKLSRINAR
ncbi:CHAP domain-containing protein [Novispirillum itersonii]|uniref:CHAP domain-containing protein n=1 Tax=Novispirillum itersonii TaxID=189 RepID=UPI000366917F|nr:CHAP domain-containing protein [Novispirillum itersonii]